MSQIEFQRFALDCFHETAQRGSIRKASEALGVSPSSVQRQLVKLEAQLGSALFERGSRGVKLAPAGEVFCDYVQRARGDLERVVSEIAALKGMRRGHVRIGCEEGIGKDLLPALVAAFRRKYAAVKVTLRIGDMPDIVQGVASGDIDVGVAFNPVTHVGIKRHAQVPVAVGAVVLPSHRLAGRERLRLADLVGEPLIVADGGFTIRRMLDVQAGSAREHLDIALESNSFEAITSLVKSGAGVAIRTMIGIAEEVARGEVVFVPISERGFHMETIAVFTRAGRPLPAACAVMSELVAQMLEGLDGMAAPRAGRSSCSEELQDGILAAQ